MTFDLTGEQRMIQTMVRQFSRNVVAANAAERDETREFPAEVFKEMGPLGLMGMMIPFEYNGSGSDAVSYALALSEIAYSCASTAVVMSVFYGTYKTTTSMAFSSPRLLNLCLIPELK